MDIFNYLREWRSKEQRYNDLCEQLKEESIIKEELRKKKNGEGEYAEEILP